MTDIVVGYTRDIIPEKVVYTGRETDTATVIVDNNTTSDTYGQIGVDVKSSVLGDHVVNTDGSIDITSDNEGNKDLSVAISNKDGNIITTKSDGLYAFVDTSDFASVDSVESLKTSINSIKRDYATKTWVENKNYLIDDDLDSIRNDIQLVNNELETKADNDSVDNRFSQVDEQLTNIGENKQDKLIAGDGITIDGNTISAHIESDSDVFWAIYGETSYDQIRRAYNDGKEILLTRERRTYRLSQRLTGETSGNPAYLFTCITPQTVWEVKVDSDSNWSYTYTSLIPVAGENITIDKVIREDGIGIDYVFNAQGGYGEGTVKSVNGIEPDEDGNVEIDIPNDFYTQEQTDNLLDTKQDKLTAGNNIEIVGDSEGNLIINSLADSKIGREFTTNVTVGHLTSGTQIHATDTVADILYRILYQEVSTFNIYYGVSNEIPTSVEGLTTQQVERTEMVDNLIELPAATNQYLVMACDKGVEVKLWKTKDQDWPVEFEKVENDDYNIYFINKPQPELFDDGKLTQGAMQYKFTFEETN